jgi:hypothetical protein
MQDSMDGLGEDVSAGAGLDFSSDFSFDTPSSGGGGGGGTTAPAKPGSGGEVSAGKKQEEGDNGLLGSGMSSQDCLGMGAGLASRKKDKEAEAAAKYPTIPVPNCDPRQFACKSLQAEAQSHNQKMMELREKYVNDWLEKAIGSTPAPVVKASAEAGKIIAQGLAGIPGVDNMSLADVARDYPGEAQKVFMALAEKFPCIRGMTVDQFLAAYPDIANARYGDLKKISTMGGFGFVSDIVKAIPGGAPVALGGLGLLVLLLIYQRRKKRVKA